MNYGVKNVVSTGVQFGANSGMHITEVAPQSLLGLIYAEISAATKDILGLADECRTSADMVFGGVDQGCSVGPEKSPRPSGLAADIREQLELHAGAISVLRNEIRRLRAL